MSKVRWARLSEIDKRVRPGTDAFNRQPLKHRHLIAWRGMHAVSPGEHKTVRRFARSQQCKPSSNLSLKKKLYFFNRYV